MRLSFYASRAAASRADSLRADERTAIERWFAGGRNTSPVTNQALRDRTLISNHALRSAIATLRVAGRT